MDNPENSQFLRRELTGSVGGVKWSPYLTTIALYTSPGRTEGLPSNIVHSDEINPVIIAKLPQPIKMIDWGRLVFKIKLDM